MRTANWSQKALKADIYYLKGIVNNMLQYCGIKNDATVTTEGEIIWKWKNQTLCTASPVAAARLNEFDIKQEVFFADIHWDNWVKAQAAAKIKYSEIPKYPAVQRDLAIVIDTAITYKQVQDITQQLKLEPLQSFGLFDVFQSEKLGKGKKSYALNYTFQLQDRTLTDADTEQLMKQLIEAYKTKLSAQIRD
jgi:phenylalanyl-tRNA synthetase beta chain